MKELKNYPQLVSRRRNHFAYLIRFCYSFDNTYVNEVVMRDKRIIISLPARTRTQAFVCLSFLVSNFVTQQLGRVSS